LCGDSTADRPMPKIRRAKIPEHLLVHLVAPPQGAFVGSCGHACAFNEATGRLGLETATCPARCTHLLVAAGILPAVEPGVPPGGETHPCPERLNYWQVRLKPGRWNRRQDAALYGRRDARRYKKAAPSRRGN
jgi:hypothetical protein